MKSSSFTVTERPCRIILTCAALLIPSVQAEGQLLESKLVIRNARVITMDGRVLDSASIVIKGDRIQSLTTTAPKTSMMTSVVDAAGKTVTPGFIDAFSALGLMDDATGSADPTARAWDGFDRYARNDFREALAHGVTTLHVGSPGTKGVTGTADVIQLVPQTGGAAGAILKERAALTINLASGTSASARIKTFKGLRGQFKAALDYRRSLEDYEEDLKEYLEKLEKEREKKDEASDKAEAEKKGDEDTPKPEDKPEPKKEKKAKRKKPRGTAEHDPSDASMHDWWVRLVQGETAEDTDEQPRPRRGRRRRPGGPPAPKKDESKKKEDKDGLKKPEQPKADRKSEVLLEAIDRKFPVRIRAHRSADIENALALADEFNLDLVIEGGTEAYLLADRLAEADVPVVLGQAARTGLYENNEYRRHSAAGPTALTEAGVRWTVGSGGSSRSAARFVALNAQLAAGQAGHEADWMRKLTVDAADILSISGKVGRLEPGARASLVIWRGEPGSPDATVDRVFVDGKLAYVAGGPGGGR